MFKRAFFTLTLAVLLGLSSAAESVVLPEFAGCKPGTDDPIVTQEGLFKVHVVCDHLLLEIPDRMYKRDMLLNTEFAGLSGSSEFIAPGTLVDNRVVRWVRRGKKVGLVVVEYEIASARTPGIERAVKATSLPGIVKVFNIVAHGTGGDAVIDVTALFTSPPSGFALGFMKHFGVRDVDPERSFVEGVKTFPDNIGIRFYQTWVADRDELLQEVEKRQESVSASKGFMFYTNIYLLPDKPMRPRFWDPRVGYFATRFQDYGTGDFGGIERGFIQRYRLEKKDPKALFSDPVKPIVFYIGRGVPEVWRPYMKQAVEDWQGVFAQVGFKDAIIARNAPSESEDPSWDPDDVRHNVIRWTPSGRRNALGAAVVDPRSGEVISSHTLLWHDVLKLLETWYFTQASPLDPRAQKLPLPPELMGELLRYVLRHEIGHALGLRHNFKASAAVSVKQLRDPQWTQLWGTSASTMSYARFNYVAQPGDGAGLLPKFGPYDYFAIEWGYKVFPEDMTPDEEHERLDGIAARQVTNPLLRFGGEDDAAAADSTVSTSALGDDPIAAGDLGLRNIDRVMSFIVPATTRTGEGYDKLSAMYEALVQQRHNELAYVSRIVGGVVETRYQAGRGKVPYDPVDPARQREAAKFLLKRAFIEPKALLDPDVLRRITPSGGTGPLQESNADLLRSLIDPAVFQRMLEASSVGKGRYTGLELLYDLNDGLFSELLMKSPVVSPYRRQVQRSYVTVLLSAAGDADALSEYRAALRSAVAELYKTIGEALDGTTDLDTQLHLRLIRAQLANVS